VDSQNTVSFRTRPKLPYSLLLPFQTPLLGLPRGVWDPWTGTHEELRRRMEGRRHGERWGRRWGSCWNQLVLGDADMVGPTCGAAHFGDP
jgi:hypothetical protein